MIENRQKNLISLDSSVDKGVNNNVRDIEADVVANHHPELENIDLTTTNAAISKQNSRKKVKCIKSWTRETRKAF